MNILLIHQNFPGQYKHLAPALAAKGHRVVGLGERANLLQNPAPDGVERIGYDTPKGAGEGTHHYLRQFEAQVRRGQAVVRALHELKDKRNFVPDLICCHPGWGEGLYLRDIFPRARQLMFFEFYYRAEGSDVGFDPEFPTSYDDRFRIRTRNAPFLMALEDCDRGISPTRWQADQFPASYRDKIDVVHDGIDTDAVTPDDTAVLDIPERGLRLTRRDEVITYIGRGLEPYRGFHTLMRALPDIQRRRPNAHVVLVGGEAPSYGTGPKQGGSWLRLLLKELDGKLDMRRIHLLGRVAYPRFLTVLRVSSAHVYLTYPFVLSWSLMEAMAAGCAVVASATPPVQEVITDGQTGLLTGFFDQQGLADRLDAVLDHPDRMAQMRQAARAHIVQNYDLRRRCLPQQIELVQALAEGRPPRL